MRSFPAHIVVQVALAARTLAASITNISYYYFYKQVAQDHLTILHSLKGIVVQVP